MLKLEKLKYLNTNLLNNSINFNGKYKLKILTVKDD